MIGHSTGGGEVTRYIGRHGTGRVSRAVLVSAIPPLMLQTPANPGGLPIAVFDGLRADLLRDRSQFYRDLGAPFYGANRPGSTVSQGVRDAFWAWSMQAGLRGAHQAGGGVSETDLTEDPLPRRSTCRFWSFMVMTTGSVRTELGTAVVEDHQERATLKVYPWCAAQD